MDIKLCLADSFPRSCVGMHTSPLSLFSGLSEGDRDLLIKVREAGNWLICSAETPSEIRMHSHAGAWEREKRQKSCQLLKPKKISAASRKRKGKNNKE
ncbi:MAG: hypothetical protein GY862_15430 [Gammaproteobacteria bacterium]|nr:hypothetical protein [Gammaproteobacteria bacterium]